MVGPVSGSPFPVRALIEGFYGVYYTHPERLSLLSFLSRHDYNLYIYAPKNDRQHRNRWREPYPERIMEEFGEAVRAAGEGGIDFCYALSPGLDIRYSADEEFEAITAKLSEFARLGVRRFSLLLDDIRRSFPDPRDGERYATFAEAQADLCNRVHDWLKDRDPSFELSMCPTEYHGSAPFPPSLHELGARLHPDIDVFYTGSEVCSATVATTEVEAFAAALRRAPIIWDNYPVNDLAMHGELHIGPVIGRAPALAGLVRGFAVNPMNQAEASKVVLATFGDYFADPCGYDPDSSWAAALTEVAGDGAPALKLVAENSLRSCLGTPEAERLERLAAAASQALEADLGDDPSVGELVSYLSELDEACYYLRYRMANLELRNELLPWLEQLERWSWLGRWSVEALRAVQTGGMDAVEGSLLRRIEEYVGLVQEHPKRIGGTVLLPLGLLALERCRSSAPA